MVAALAGCGGSANGGTYRTARACFRSYGVVIWREGGVIDYM